MFSKIAKLAVALALTAFATTSDAATYKYALGDHPNGSLTGAPNFHEYGLRLDYYKKVFSFDNGASAMLTYDDVAKTAVITGTMVESLGGNTFGGTWTIQYMMTGLTDLGNGFFKDLTGTGSGSISMGMTSLALGTKGNDANPVEYFVFADDGHRIGGNALVGRGWVDPKAGLGGANDFLFTASVVPLPAAGWMMLSVMAGAGFAARRKRKAS